MNKYIRLTLIFSIFLCFVTTSYGSCNINADCIISNQCVEIVCEAGACVITNILIEDTPCNDNNLCTMDSCSRTGGACFHFPVNCNDGDSTTIDTCDPDIGCIHTICEVGFNCGPDTLCSTFSCVPNIGCVETPNDCNNNNPCTSDSCDPNIGCVNTPIPNCCSFDEDCMPRNPCLEAFCIVDVGTGTLACESFSLPVEDTPCNDNNPCTSDSCNINTGECSNILINNCCLVDEDCIPTNHCLDSICSINEFTGLGMCISTLLPVEDTPCNDNDLCTLDACFGANGACLNAPVNCNDNDDTTEDSCEPEIGCVFTPIATCGNGVLEGDEECDDTSSCCKDCKLLSFGNIESRFVGKSTQIELFQPSCDDPNETSRFLKFKLNSIKEENSKNKITQLASQHLDFIGPEDREMFGTTVSYTELSGSMKQGKNPRGNVKIAIMFFLNEVDIEIGNNTFHISKNSIKFNIELSNWPFESINNRLIFSLRLKASDLILSTSDEDGIIFEFPLAEGSTEEKGFGFFPFSVIVDGKEDVLTIDHTEEGTHVDINLVFPNFESTLAYDPVGWFKLETSKIGYRIEETSKIGYQIEETSKIGYQIEGKETLIDSKYVEPVKIKQASKSYILLANILCIISILVL